MPKISVITTTYRHQDFIAQTIESILGQTYTDRELLIGDDSPDDATRDVIQGYVAQYPDKIKARHHKPNKGIVDNTNFLLSKMSTQSEYIAFLEGDDMYDPENLASKLIIFQKQLDIGCVYSHHCLINGQGQALGGSSLHLSHLGRIERTLSSLLVVGNPIHSFGSVMISKTIANKIFPLTSSPLWTEKMFGPLDYWTWTRLLPQCISYGLDKPLLIYRKQENNYTKQIVLFNKQLETIYQYYINNNPDDQKILSTCQYFIVINEIVSRMIAGTGSLSYRYTNRKNYRGGKDRFIMLLYTILGYCPRVLFDPFYQWRLGRKYTIKK